jgi:hypothetical protein
MRYLKLDSGISSCEEGLNVDVWTKILQQFLLGIILYYVINIQGLYILILLIIIIIIIITYCN